MSATLARRSDEGQAALNEYVEQIADGVTAHQGHIDELLSGYSMGWPLERMRTVDRAILRIGTFEILWRDDVPDALAIAEAVVLVPELSADESSSFVNGLLARIADVKPRLVLES